MELDGVYQLSRFAHLVPGQDGGFILETPVEAHRFQVQSISVLRLLLVFCRPTRLRNVLDSCDASARKTIQTFLEVCWAKRILVEVNADGATREDEGPLATWEFHDLFFHARSRIGRNPNPLGGTYRFRGILDEEPAIRPTDRRATPVLLPRGDISPGGSGTMSLAQALELRRSLYDSEALTSGQLAEFLFRTFRITKLQSATDSPNVQKVYPSAGSLHPLELYLVAYRCSGLDQGLYRYLACEHALAPICGMETGVHELLTQAQRSTGRLTEYPSVLMIVTARFRRTAWKYQSIAYRLTLIELGALYQTMYLTATAMGLAPCALGAGNSDSFASLAGTDYFAETSIGEFILAGRRAAPSSSPAR